jgi:GT2 family glycosyltransferase
MTATAAITLCIINRNGADHLESTLRAARAQSWEFAEVVVVDDASDDDSMAIVSAAWPEARIVRLDHRRGPGGARNAGLAIAANDLVLCQDNDVRLQADTVGILCASLRERPQALLVAPRVTYEHDRDLIQYDSADCHFLALMLTRNAGCRVAEAEACAAATSSLVTACFLIDRSRWSGGEYFDESFGFNLEDHDFGVRARLRGHQLWVDPSASVVHGAGSAALSYRPGQEPATQRLFYLVRNRWFVIAKCYSLRTLVVLLPALMLFETCQLLVLGAKGSLHVWASAVRSLRREWPRLRRERRAVQQSRRVADAAILRGGSLPMTDWLRRNAMQRAALTVLDRGLNEYWRLVSRLI